LAADSDGLLHYMCPNLETGKPDVEGDRDLVARTTLKTEEGKRRMLSDECRVGLSEVTAELVPGVAISEEKLAPSSVCDAYLRL